MVSMRYVLKDLQRDFPDDDACLQLIFDSRYGNAKTCPKCGIVDAKFYRVGKRPAFKCKECRQYIYPLAGTIFEKSTTPLTDWFHVLYLFSVSKNGVSAKEIERQVRVSYKTAHRMAKMIRMLMHESVNSGDMLGLSGKPVEVDETYVKGKGKHKNYHDNSSPVLAALEVDGQIRTQVVDRATSMTALPFLKKNVYEYSMLHTDESKIYKHKQVKQIYRHESVRHIAHEYVRDGVTTNHVEGFFGQLKRSLDGTHHAVSPYYLYSYVSEYAFRYNHRHEDVFSLLLAKVGTQV